MKQVVQNYKTGALKVEEVPDPIGVPNSLLVETKASLISAGTERTKIETAKMNIIEKAFTRLDLVKTIFANIKQEGIVFTIKKAMNRLDSPVSLGYSCAGIVRDRGAGVKNFKVGDRVACVGEGSAAHSEVNSIFPDYAANVPENVDFDEASFAGLGSIALHSVDSAMIKEGESVVVIGLGLIGQLVMQILKSKGCTVLGVDIDNQKIQTARNLGLDYGCNPLNDDVLSLVKSFTNGNLADAVIVAAASKTSQPLEVAGQIVKNKGRVILVGAMPICIPRKEYYEKEITFMISRSFGADLYYKENKNHWYPYGYMPKTVNETMAEFLSLVAKNKILLKPLITHRFNLNEAQNAYKLISSGKESYFGVLFNYNENPVKSGVVSISQKAQIKGLNIGFLGAGNFAQGYLLPSLRRRDDVNLVGVAAGRGLNAKSAAEKFGFNYSTTDSYKIINDESIDVVFITTRHNLHGKMVVEALKKGKSVFVEKPLCINKDELSEIVRIYDEDKHSLMAGFNRRFSNLLTTAKSFFSNRIGPLHVHYRVNAGSLPKDHWLLDKYVGGGRIIGEVCHFVDLLQFLIQSAPMEVYAAASNLSETGNDVSLIIKYKDGSIGMIDYSTEGDASFPRERIEIFGENSAVAIDNFNKAVYSRSGRSASKRLFSRDIGHANELNSYIDSLKTGDGKSLIPFKEIAMTTYITFKIEESINTCLPVEINNKDLFQIC
ncbi:MAG: bi-domain-containing oxidoreductase [bacterium]